MDWPGEQLLIKLWETLAEKGIGSLLTPWQIIREGKARNEIRRHELLMLAQAEVDANEIRAGRKQLNMQTPPSSLPAPTALRIPDTQGVERIEPHLDFDSLAAVSMRSDIAQAAQKEINWMASTILTGRRQLSWPVKRDGFSPFYSWV